MNRCFAFFLGRTGKQKAAAALAALLVCGGTLAQAETLQVFDPPLQQVAEAAIRDTLAEQPQLSGIVVAMDLEGRVLALADNRPKETLTPLALTVSAAPGYTLLPMTALAALASGQLLPEETIDDAGYFLQYTTDMATAPKCWISDEQRYKHQHQTVKDALANCCEYFFYTLGSRLGDEAWADMGKAMGLDSLSGLNVPGEALGLLAGPQTLYDPALPLEGQKTQLPGQVYASLAAHLQKVGQDSGIENSQEALAQCANGLMQMAAAKSQPEWLEGIRASLRDDLGFSEEIYMKQAAVEPVYELLNTLKWDGQQRVQAAVGRSLTRITPMAMARYWALLANGGRLVEARLPQAGGEEKPQSALDLSGELGAYLPLVKEGISGILDATGQAYPVFLQWTPYRTDVCSLVAVGEASGADTQAASWMVGFAPQKEPKVVVVALVPGTKDTTLPATLFAKVMGAYLGR